MDEIMPQHQPSLISEFYRDRCIFITGATGFLGKVLVEKLLRSCPKIKAIYVLMRAKKDQDIRDRMDHAFLKNVMFDELIREKPEMLTKLVPVEGDISLPNLGISSSDLELLADNVSVVFHSAATVRFNEELRTAVNLNVKGPQRLLHICHQMKHLVALVHVSTAFTNLHLQKIEEVIYQTSIQPTELLQLVDYVDDESLLKITDRLLGECPNTYTFTKAIAEKLIEEERGDIPTAIVRPSIVTAALQEPLPGWIDNINHITGIIAGMAKGILRVVRCKKELVADIIPVDIAINLMIAVAWYTATQNQSNEIPVFTCSTGQHNSISWKKLRDYSYMFWIRKPIINMIWHPSKLGYFSGKFAYRAAVFFYHYMPAYILDFPALLMGKKANRVRLYTKIDERMSITSFFSLRQFQFVNDNFIPLLDQMSAEDRQTYNFDVRQINWQSYVEDYCLGIRQYILKEDDETIPAARTSLMKFRVLQKILQALILILPALFLVFLFI